VKIPIGQFQHILKNFFATWICDSRVYWLYLVLLSYAYY
jgi:hypothetical protein